VRGGCVWGSVLAITWTRAVISCRVNCCRRPVFKKKSGFNITIKRRRLATAADPATCEFYFLQHRHRRLANADSPMIQQAPMTPILMSDVYIGRTLISKQLFKGWMPFLSSDHSVKPVKVSGSLVCLLWYCFSVVWWRPVWAVVVTSFGFMYVNLCMLIYFFFVFTAVDMCPLSILALKLSIKQFYFCWIVLIALTVTYCFYVMLYYLHLFCDVRCCYVCWLPSCNKPQFTSPSKPAYFSALAMTWFRNPRHRSQ